MTKLHRDDKACLSYTTDAAVGEDIVDVYAAEHTKRKTSESDPRTRDHTVKERPN